MAPFSGKQKKKQLQEKRQRKREQPNVDNERVNRGGRDTLAEPKAHDCQRGSSSDCEHDRYEERNKEEYKYGADRLGIRSVFLKETTEEVAERKKLSYERLANRHFMGSEGIPFGKWFDMPGSTRAAAMPLSVEIPTRGWSVDGTQTSGVGVADTIKEDADEGEVVEESETFSNHTDVDALEQYRFKRYIQSVDRFCLPGAMGKYQISSYERNIDVWRQLWRTVELSDVVIIVTDARYPIVHLPLSLLHYIVRECRKACVVVLNKADLVPRQTLEKWSAFLQSYFVVTGIVSASDEEAAATGVVREIPLVPFTALPSEETAVGTEAGCNTMKRRKKKARRNKLYEQLRTGKLQLCTDGDSEVSDDDDNSDDLEKEIGKLVPAAVARGATKVDDADSYAATDNFRGMRKAERELQHDRRDHKELQIVSDMISSLLQQCRDIGLRRRNGITGSATDGASKDHGSEAEVEGGEGGEDEYVHIGFVGHPNVGKSSLLNCIRGTKVVSVSSTAGHTKHLQTIPIPSERVVLIDSPGLAFPVFGLPRPLQAVFGTHQIAQTRDPQSGVAYLATHLQLERLYGLPKPENYDVGDEDRGNHGPCGSPNAWSPYELCESYARKKGYFVKRGKGTLDVHRGAIELLQEAYEGRLVLFLAPPDVSWLQSDDFRKDLQPFLLIRVMTQEGSD